MTLLSFARPPETLLMSLCTRQSGSGCTVNDPDKGAPQLSLTVTGR